jgi:hypothetical protein
MGCVGIIRMLLCACLLERERNGFREREGTGTGDKPY